MAEDREAILKRPSIDGRIWGNLMASPLVHLTNQLDDLHVCLRLADLIPFHTVKETFICNRNSISSNPHLWLG